MLSTNDIIEQQRGDSYESRVCIDQVFSCLTQEHISLCSGWQNYSFRHITCFRTEPVVEGNGRSNLRLRIWHPVVPPQYVVEHSGTGPTHPCLTDASPPDLLNGECRLTSCILTRDCSNCPQIKRRLPSGSRHRDRARRG